MKLFAVQQEKSHWKRNYRTHHILAPYQVILQSQNTQHNICETPLYQM